MHTQNKDDRSSPALLSTYVIIWGSNLTAGLKKKKYVFLKDSVSHMVELRLKKKKEGSKHIYDTE